MMKPLTKFAMLLLALLLAACTFDPGEIVFVFGYDLPQVDISFPTATSTPSETATISPTIVPSATPTLTPTVTSTPSASPTFEPSPTRETLNRIRINANTNIRTAPNGSVVRVAQSGSEFVVLSQRDGWLSISDGWIFFGGWVEFISGRIDDVPVSQAVQSRISYNINGVAVPDWDYLWAHLEAIQPTTLLIMDNIFAACEAAERLPNTLIIHRDYSQWEGEEWLHRPDTSVWISRWRGEGCYQVVRYTTNEPSLYNIGAFVSQEIALMDAAAAEGIRLSVGNFAVGTLPDWAVQSGLFDDWLRAVVRGGHIIGAHEYTTGILPFGTGVYSRQQLFDPASMQPQFWITDLPIAYVPFSAQSEPDPIISPFGVYEQSQATGAIIAQDATTCAGNLPTYWHILRTTWLLLRAQCIGLDADDITIVNTEGLWDNLSDIDVPGVIEPIKIWRQRYGLDKYMRDMRGLPTYENLWRAYYPQWTTAQAAVCQLVWWDYIAPENYLGVNIFTWSTNQLWISFDVSGVQASYLYEFHTLLEQWAQGADMTQTCGDYAWAA